MISISHHEILLIKDSNFHLTPNSNSHSNFYSDSSSNYYSGSDRSKKNYFFNASSVNSSIKLIYFHPCLFWLIVSKCKDPFPQVFLLDLNYLNLEANNLNFVINLLKLRTYLIFIFNNCVSILWIYSWTLL